MPKLVHRHSRASRTPLRAIISEREMELPKAELGKLLQIAVERKNVISLGPGEPDFHPPKHVITAAKQALDKGYTHYSPVEGRKELREALAKKLKRENRINVDPDDIIVTCGSNEAIMLALMATIDPGEAALVPDPGFVDYIPTLEMLNGVAISVPTRPTDGWQILPESVLWQLKEPQRVRAIIINSPNNPTGAVYTKKTLEAIADIAVEYDLLIISDEAYEKFVYGKPHISPASLNGMSDYVLTLQSFSKTYGMAGFRLGYAAGSPKVIKAMTDLHLYSAICAPTISQIAGLAALTGPQKEIRKNVAEFQKRRDYMYKRLCELDYFTCNKPDGAFYIFAKYASNMRSLQFCHWLLDKAKVAVVPGRDFGRYGEGYVRFSYATDLRLIKKAMDRIEHVVKFLK
ncbi:MAG: pyridoxal phosphate-dependent aminotransferase [Candidatus Aenigmatarchaeota archaeon]